MNGWQELKAVLHRRHLARRLPQALRIITSTMSAITRAYNVTVAPLVHGATSGVPRAAHTRRALRAGATKYASLMCSYAYMTEVSFPPDVAVLAGTFARLYDDLLDEGHDQRFGQRVEALFAGRPFDPVTTWEKLLDETFIMIVERTGLEPSDQPFADLRLLHEYQVLSSLQRIDSHDAERLHEITLGKGRQASLVLFGLMHSRMRADERALVGHLGEMVQLLDDYRDSSWDRRNGFVTPMTVHTTDLSDICRRLDALSHEAADVYGAERSEQFVGLLYGMLCNGVIGRRAALARAHPWVVRGGEADERR